MGSKVEDRGDALEDKMRQLKAQQQRVAARRQALQVRRTRREETRRKILVGAVVLEKVGRGEIDEAVLRGWLEGALTREEDRGLFDLPPMGSSDPSPTSLGRSTERP